MAKKSNVLSFVVLGVAGYAAYRYLPGMLRAVSASTGGGGTTGGASSNPLAALLKPLTANPLKPSAGTPGATTLKPLMPADIPIPKGPPSPSLMSGNQGGPSVPHSGAKLGLGMESILTALLSGNSGVDQSTLAGIYNIQTGAGDFAGDSRQSMADSWLNNLGYGNDTLAAYDIPSAVNYQDANQTMTDIPSQSIPGYWDIPYQDSSQAYMSDIPSQSIPGYYDSSTAQGNYADFGNYPTDTGGGFASGYENTDYLAYGPNGAMSYDGY